MDFSNYQQHRGFFFREGTSKSIMTALADAFDNRSTVRVWLGDVVTGRAWAEEYEVMGTIGRSCGPVKVPLLVERNEDGGGHLPDHCVVRIDVVRRRTLSASETRSDGHSAKSVLAGTTAYAHPSFHAGDWVVRDSALKGYTQEVLMDGEVHARFRSAKRAAEYSAFMSGQGYLQS